MSADPVSWKMIERGWRVLDAEGNEVGEVDQITGDLDADIFDGLTVSDGGSVLTRPRYVASEHVGAIREGEVTLDLSAQAVARLEPYTEPVSEPLEALEPERAGQAGTGAGETFLQRISQLLLGRRS